MYKKIPLLFKGRWREVPEGFSKENHPSIPSLKRRGRSGNVTHGKP
ncbi:MAG: hypothetical protein ACE5EN_04510 [Nitrospinota bacterium]